MEIFKKKKHKELANQWPDSHELTRKNLVWESANGRKTRISEMDFNHLQNAYNKMERGEFSAAKQNKYKVTLKHEITYRAHERYKDEN